MAAPEPPPGFTHLSRIGAGTFGDVFAAVDAATGAQVALKRLRPPTATDAASGLPLSAARELTALQTLRSSPSIVRLHRVARGPDGALYLVTERALGDVGRVLDAAPRPFSVAAAKRVALDLLEGLDSIHAAWWIHRDVKASNLLIRRDGSACLCDFGLARRDGDGDDDGGGGGDDDDITAPPPLTAGVVTLWYRAPELLRGGASYGSAIDSWAAGCVIGEVVQGEPMFPARSENESATMHAAWLGAPSASIWPDLAAFPAAAVYAPPRPGTGYNRVAQRLPTLSPAGVALINSLLTFDPTARASARDALRSPWFEEHPLPAPRRAVAAAAGAALELAGDSDRAAARAQADAEARRRRDSRWGVAFGRRREGGGAGL